MVDVQVDHQKTANNRTWLWTGLVFGVILVAEILGAYYYLYLKGYILADAISRTANAYYVLFIEPRKLASIGLVWNPLPSFLQLPILLFSSFWRPLASHAVAGGMVTAVFAAANAAFIFRCFKHYRIKTGISLLLVALYAFNPFIFYYGCNGMSETLFFTTLILCVAYLAKWLDCRSNLHLIMIAIVLAVSFLCRYEALALALGLAISFILVAYAMEDPQSPFKPKPLSMKTEYFIATSVVVFLPLLYTVFVWIFLNWSIMSDPLYFLNSSYSNSAQSEYILNPVVVEALSTPVNTVKFVLVKMLPFLPVFLVLTVVRLLNKKFMQGDYWILVVLIGSLSVFHWFMLMNHKSFGWLRFYCFALPICMAWLPYELSQLKLRMQKVLSVAVVGALIVSAVTLPVYFENQVLAPEEFEVMTQSDVSGVNQQNAAAKWINENYYNSVLLMDSFTMASLIVNLENPENLIITTSEQFTEAVANPARHGVRYLIVANPSGVGALDALNVAYPNLYHEGADWCIEREEIGGLKVFEVLY